jgi:hypothetical protein
MSVPTIEEFNEAATVINPPPGMALVDEDVALKKGDIIAHFNHWVGLWHVKRVVKAGRPTRSSYRSKGDVYQTDINYVSHDAQPIEGKTGASASHYVGRAGFGQIASTHQLTKDGAFPWYLVDMGNKAAEIWIAEQDQLWADKDADVKAEEERDKGTPEAFHARMERRAQQIDNEARRLADQAEAMRQLAEAVRTEVRGRWVK